MAGWLSVLTLLLAVAAVHRPFGDYMFRVVSGRRDSAVERGVYRLVGVDRTAEQTWGVYARSVLAFSAVSILFLYAFLRWQDRLWLSLGFDPVSSHVAWNTAVSFVTNTNWQAYAGEATLGHLVRRRSGWPCRTSPPPQSVIAVAVALHPGTSPSRQSGRSARQLLGRPDPHHAVSGATTGGGAGRTCCC